jgi:hypothetical protein
MALLQATLLVLSTLCVVQNAVQPFFERYLRSETGGDSMARQAVVEFSPRRAAFERQRDPLLKGLVIDWVADPVVVITGYSILDHTCRTDRCVVRVKYDKLLRTSGYGDHGGTARKFVKSQGTETVEYQVALRQGHFRVIDPPEPRVLLSSIISYYETLQELKRDPAEYPLESQRAYHQKLLDELAYLKEQLQSESKKR